MTLCDTEGEKDKSDSIFHSPSGIYEKSNTETNFSLREILNREIESYTKPLNVKKRKRYLVWYDLINK